MESDKSGNTGYVSTLQAGLTRRALLRRAAAFGAAAPIVAGLLAACGGSSSATQQPTGSTSSGGAGSTATTSATPGGAAQTAASPVGSPSAQATQAGTAKFTIEPAKHKGGKIIFGQTADAQTANSILSQDTSSGAIISMMFEGMTQTDPTNASPQGRLAKSWEISQDGITYTFTLQDGVKWHDGQPFTANDVKFTYDLMMNKDSKSVRYSTLVDRIASVDAPDDSHAVFKLKKPNAAFLASNCGYGIIPQHILKDVQPSGIAQDPFSTGKKGRTIGTGPFMFEEWVKDDHVTVVKNPNYWQGAPNLDQWIMKIVPNATVLTQQLKTGEVDYGSIQAADYADMQKQDNVDVQAYNSFSFIHYCQNLDPAKTKVFQEKEVRQALLYALDRKGIADAVYFGLAEVAVGTMPVLSWAYNPDGIKLKYPYDVDKAKSLLDGAGWKVGSGGIREKNGQKLAFTLLTTTASQPLQQVATICQQAWKQVGADVKVNAIEWNAFITTASSSRDFDMYLEGFNWGVDPDQSTMFTCAAYDGGFNDGKYCNPQVDKLLADALATTDQAKRKQIYTEYQNVLLEDLPEVIMLFPKSITGVNKRVHNYFPNAINTTFDAHQWWVDA